MVARISRCATARPRRLRRSRPPRPPRSGRALRRIASRRAGRCSQNLGNPDLGVREQAIVEAAELGEPDSVRALAALAEREGKLANRAGNALGTVHAKTAAPVLVELLASESVLVRANAARALGAAGGHDQADALARLVTDEQQPQRVRQEAALSLARIGRPEDVTSLVGVLEAPDEQLRISAVQALAQLDGPIARKALEQHARGSLSQTERAYVDRALATR